MMAFGDPEGGRLLWVGCAVVLLGVAVAVILGGLHVGAW